MCGRVERRQAGVSDLCRQTLGEDPLSSPSQRRTRAPRQLSQLGSHASAQSQRLCGSGALNREASRKAGPLRAVPRPLETRLPPQRTGERRTWRLPRFSALYMLLRQSFSTLIFTIL